MIKLFSRKKKLVVSGEEPSRKDSSTPAATAVTSTEPLKRTRLQRKNDLISWK